MCSKCKNVNVEIISQAFHEKTTVDEITQVNNTIIFLMDAGKHVVRSLGPDVRH